MPEHTCKICCRDYECPWCTDAHPNIIGCMGMAPKVYPRLEHFHFICSKNCMNDMVDNWKLIDQTANLDISLRDLEESISRNKKRKLNELTREESKRVPTDSHVLDMPLGPVWSSLPCAFGDSSTFFAHHRGQQMYLEKNAQNGPFSLGT